MFISLLVFLIILAFVAWLVFTLVPMEPNIATIAKALFGIIALFAVTDAMGITHFGILASLPIR